MIPQGRTETQHRVIAIVGPTASGKSGLAIALAKKLHGEVISADSRQVYKELNIGSGKVTKQEMRGVPHHLLSVTNPKHQYSVAEFVQKARATIEAIVARGHVPIVCGGTGLYVDTLLMEKQIPEVKPNKTLRKRFEKLSVEKLFALLSKKDPVRAQTIDRHNKVRLVRALEIIETLGKVPELQPAKSRYNILWIGLAPKQTELKKKIHTRLHERMKAGMLREARTLHAQGLSWKRMEELGLEYRYLARYLQNKITKIEMLEQLENEIWHYTKRQMRWFKRNAEIQWFKTKDTTRIEKISKKFLIK